MDHHHYRSCPIIMPVYPLHPMVKRMHTHNLRQQLLMEEAIQIARSQVEGQVVQAELEREHGRLIFEVEIINAQGEKYEVEIDANTGEVLSVELD